MALKISALLNQKKMSVASIPEMDLSLWSQEAYGYKRQTVKNETDGTTVWHYFIGCSNSMGKWIHPTQDRIFIVLRGSIRVDLGSGQEGKSVRVMPGQTFRVEFNMPYLWTTEAENSEVLIIQQHDHEEKLTLMEEAMIRTAAAVETAQTIAGNAPVRVRKVKSEAERVAAVLAARNAAGVPEGKQIPRTPSPTTSSAAAEYAAATSGPSLSLDMRQPGAAVMKLQSSVGVSPHQLTPEVQVNPDNAFGKFIPAETLGQLATALSGNANSPHSRVTVSRVPR